MKKLFLSTLLLALPLLASAYDIAVENTDGVTIYYNYYNDGTELEVTYNQYGTYSYFGEVNIPEEVTYMGRKRKVTSIGNSAFSHCSGLTSITIPNSVTTIGSEAFYYCSNLSSVTIGNSVTSIGESAFNRCSSLTSVTIPNSVTNIGGSAFGNCTSLTSITIPNSVTTIGSVAFWNCSALTSVHIIDLERWCKISFGGDYSNPLSCAHHLYINGGEIKDLVIPFSVTSIGNYTFNGCSSLTSVTIPNSVTSIGSSAFRGCSGLISVTIPNSVNSIGGYAFEGCSGLATVTIPNSVTSIGNFAFWNCTGLLSVIIPNSVTTLGRCSFRDCTSLISVDIPNSVTSIEEWTFNNCRSLSSVTIPNSVTLIGERAFVYCTSLTSITIPNSVTTIGEYAFQNCSGLTSIFLPNSLSNIEKGAFAGCSDLKILTLPDNLTVIKQSTFQYCSSLTEVVIPAKVEYIYAEAFANCGLNSVSSLAVNPPFCHDLAFSNYDIPLYVPDESLNSYQGTNPWSKFSALKTLSGDPVDNKCATPTISYANKKLTFSCVTESVEYVYEIKDVDVKKGYDAEVDLSATYEISVYATKSGYTNSDVATATLVWTDAVFTETTPSASSAKAIAESIPMLISAQNGTITVRGEQNGFPLTVYTADGKMLGSATIKDGQASISTNINSGGIAVVKVANKAVKILMQ